MPKLLVIALVAIVSAAIVWFVTTTSTGEAQDVMVTGAYSAAPLLQAIAARFQEANPGNKVAVQSSGSARAISDVELGRSDIGLVARDPTAAERRRYHWFPLADDAVAVIVNRRNPVDALSAAQLAAVYTGRITDWGRIGGTAGPIKAIGAAEDSALRTVFNAFLGASGTPVSTRYSAGILAAVAGDPAAVGYASFAVARTAPDGAAVKAVAVGSLRPAPQTIAAGRYPMSHGVYLVTRGAPAGLVERFIRYAVSPAVQDLIRRDGFVPRAPPSPAPPAGEGGGKQGLAPARS